MTVLAFTLFVIAVVTMVLVHVRMQRGLADRLYDRQIAADRNAKAVLREAQRALAEAERERARAQHMHEDTQLLHGRVDETLADPRLRRFLNEGG